MKLLLKDALQKAARLLLAGLLLLGGVKGHAVYAQTSGSTPSPAAKGAYLRGVAAAGQKDWELAIKYFGQAREAAPTWPDALYNLAYSHQQAGGRELIAIAWYQGYLAAAPGAADADKVRIWIAELEVKVEVRLRRLIQMAKENAEQIEDEGSKYNAYQAIVYAQAEAGDIAGAKETAAQLTDDPPFSKTDEAQAALWGSGRRVVGYEYKSDAYKKIATAQAEAGDIAGARETAARITDEKIKLRAYRDIVWAQANAGDFAGAKETAARITDEYDKSSAYNLITKKQGSVGDFAGAKATAALISDESLKSNAYYDTAFTQAKVGDIAGARETATLITDVNYRSRVRDYIKGRAKSGDIAGAKAQGEEVEEIESWTWLATRTWFSESVFLVDWQGFLNSLEDKEPDKVVESLAEAANELADALSRIRKKEAKWQKRRAGAAK